MRCSRVTFDRGVPLLSSSSPCSSLQCSVFTPFSPLACDITSFCTMFAVCSLQFACFEIPLQPPSERISYTTDPFVLLANYSNDWTSPHLIFTAVPQRTRRFRALSWSAHDDCISSSRRSTRSTLPKDRVLLPGDLTPRIAISQLRPVLRSISFFLVTEILNLLCNVLDLVVFFRRDLIIGSFWRYNIKILYFHTSGCLQQMVRSK